MNPLSSLPPPFLHGLAPPEPARPSSPAPELPADASPLHVGPAGVRPIDDIERDFVAALCEAPNRD